MNREWPIVPHPTAEEAADALTEFETALHALCEELGVHGVWVTAMVIRESDAGQCGQAVSFYGGDHEMLRKTAAKAAAFIAYTATCLESE